MGSEERIADDGLTKADHLCVLVHGLWGNPKHLSFVAESLREKHSADRLHILVARTNSNSFTYDGIDLGGERVAQEIEDYIEDLDKAGTKLKKISVVGYSLGGLIARYTIGLLYSRGYFDKLQPVNFTTFASPHLGVRTPFMGVHYSVWNILGARTLSTSGRQLFTIDTFRDTNRPLLSVLADPDSIFMTALSKFKHRVLYANIINDRSAPYYTTSISTSDPFSNLDALTLHHLDSYTPTILDPRNPATLKPPEAQPALLTRLAATSQALISQAPLFALLGVLVPIGTVAFLLNSGVQSIRSQQRIKLHEAGKGGVGLGSYRIPLMIENARVTVEEALDNLGTSQPRPGHEDAREPPRARRDSLVASERRLSEPNGHARPQQNGHAQKSSSSANSSKGGRFRGSLNQLSPALPHKLNLTDEQFQMVEHLDELGFKKYRVHIQQVRHTHAAIIVRIPGRKGFGEGKVVVRHWLEEEFEI